MSWGFGAISWFVVIAISGIFATYATVQSQKVVQAVKREKQRQFDLGLKPNVAKPVPNLWTHWDMIINLNGLIYPRRVNSSVQVFELMRIMAFFWVVFAHEFAYRLTNSQNFTDETLLDYTSNSWGFTIIETGFYAVDIFLFIGGYVSILANTKYVTSFENLTYSKWPVVYCFAILKRYIRIMPAYAVMMLFFWKVIPAMTYGPFSSQAHMCTAKTFWESWILGWDSSITNSTMCAGWCWYLAVDF